MRTGNIPTMKVVRLSDLQLHSGTEEYIRHITTEDESQILTRSDYAEILIMLRDAASDDMEMKDAFQDGISLADFLRTNAVNAIYIDEPK